MALIAMCCRDTNANGRSWMTQKTIESLRATVDFGKHRLIIVDNDSCRETKDLLAGSGFQVITLPENVGTARAINKAWALREPGENSLKMDNDVVIHQAGWVDKLEECLKCDRRRQDGKRLGIIALKRRDLLEWPLLSADSPFRSRLIPLPHEPGEEWNVVEPVAHCIGTVQMYSHELLDKIGYLYQMGAKYAFDDSLAAARCNVSGFYSAFYPFIRIDHIDPGGTRYTEFKKWYAGKMMEIFLAIRDEYLSGRRSPHHGPDDPCPPEWQETMNRIDKAIAEKWVE